MNPRHLVLETNVLPLNYAPIKPNLLNKKINTKLVEVEGLEPPAPWSQTTCATKLRYTSIMAEKEGFEPSRPVNRTYSLSRGASSAT